MPEVQFDPDVTNIRHASLAVRGAEARAARTLAEMKVEVRHALDLFDQAWVNLCAIGGEAYRINRIATVSQVREGRARLRRALGMEVPS